MLSLFQDAEDDSSIFNFCVCVQSWDLVEQTQNYLKLLLHIINSDGR